MAIGKNKKLGKKKKGGKKEKDAFLRKEWYHVRTPAIFAVRNIGRTVVSKTQGTKIARDSLLGRVFKVSLGDLKPNSEEDAYRKFHFKVMEIQGNQCLTNFHGMSLSTDKIRSMVRKWHTLIEAHTEVTTSDGYTLRLFLSGLTKAMPNQNKKTSYATSAQVRAIRKKMVEIVEREAASSDLMDLVQKFIPETIGSEIEKATQGIYPLSNVVVRKVKVLRAPKTDVSKLIELHGGSAALADLGKPVERVEEAAPAAAPATSPKAAAKKAAPKKKAAGKKAAKKAAPAKKKAAKKSAAKKPKAAKAKKAKKATKAKKAAPKKKAAAKKTAKK